MNEGTTEQDASSLLRRLSDWTDRLEGSGIADPSDALRLRELITQSRAERLDLLNDPLLAILLCGPTAVGKSSLINALAGADISAPGLGATTSTAIVYLHDDDDATRLFEYSHFLGELGGKDTSVVRHAQTALRHKVLVDTPDIDSALRNHARLTSELVHCADIVLFVTSPEKYKVAQSLAWIAQEREQRALGFVLNKWDRESLGRQRASRDRIERDFRGVLADIGFRDPMLFRVSLLVDQNAESDGIENDIAGLRLWLESGLDRSTASDIQNRRRRAAWGRIGAAVAAVRPASLMGHTFLATAAERFEVWRLSAAAAVQAEAATVPFLSLAGDARPVTPGLYGRWMRWTGRAVGFPGPIARMKGLAGAALSLLPGQSSTAIAAPPRFGDAAAASHGELVGWLERQALATKFTCGPVASTWRQQAGALGNLLTRLPAELEQQIANRQQATSIRRILGCGVLYGMDLAMTAVLLLGLWRLAEGYAIGNYATAGLMGNGLVLLMALALVGDLAGGLFFPGLQDAARRTLNKAATGVLTQAVADAQSVLADHVRATEELAMEGSYLIDDIDRIVGAISLPGSGSQLGDRLFGESREAEETACVEPAECHPVFD